MTIKDVLNLYNKINSDIALGNISEAFFLIKKLVRQTNDWSLSMEVEEYSVIYKNMLRYKILNDAEESEEQKHIYDKLIFDLYSLNMKAKEKYMQKYSKWVEYEGYRFMSANLQSLFNGVSVDFVSIIPALEELQKNIESNFLSDNEDKVNYNIDILINKYQKYTSLLFSYIHFNNDLIDTEIDIIKQIIEDEKIGADIRAISISALTLNILRYFDSKKLSILLSYCTDNTVDILRQRAIVGVVLIIAKYGDIISHDSYLTNRLEFLSGNEIFVSEFQSILFQIIRTTETSAVSKHINEEIMPEILKLTPKIRNKFDELFIEEDEEDIKPKLQNFLEEADISDKLQNFAEMQISGVDVFADTFSKMKNFPFFMFMENWFLPFNVQNPYISNFFKDGNNIANLISLNPSMCNSDKFSFAFNMMHMPEIQMRMAKNAMEAENEQMNDMLEDLKKTGKVTDSKNMANHYILDIYRFYTYFPRHKDFDNPLPKILSIYKNKVFDIILGSDDNIESVAGYYYQYNHYHQAIDLYSKIIDTEHPNLGICKSLAYSYQKTGDYQSAINYYILAEGFDNNRTWFLKRMAFCYRKLGMFDKAIECYNDVLKLHQDDFKVMFKLAVSYIENQDYHSALPILYKIKYLKEDYPRIDVVIIWCLMYCNKFEQAKDIIIKGEPLVDDIQYFTIAGHIFLLLGEKEESLSHYNKAILKAKDLKSFNETFFEDNEKLLEVGISQEEIQLIYEFIIIGRFKV